MKTNQVLNGDCLELLPSIPSKSVDMILCDLPYGTTACSWDSVIPLDRLWAEYERVIKDNGNIVLTAQGMFCAELMCYRKTWFNHDYVWIKNQHSNFALVGIQPLRIFENVLVFRPPRKDDIEIQFNKELRAYFKQVNEFIGKSKKEIIDKIGQSADHCFRYASSQFELCTRETYDQLIACFKIDQMQGFLNFETLQSMKEELTPFTFNFDDRIKSTKQIKNNAFNKEMYVGKRPIKDIGYTKTLYDNYPRNTLYFDCERGKHPTQKPVALFEYLIRTYSNEGEVVLDNCSGSGTTAIACLNSNRRFICMERDETYYKSSLERIANHEPLLNLGK
jgi:site-specific DNA-methyltransferase (adenine-specific)